MTKKLTNRIENVYNRGSQGYVDFQLMVQEYNTFKSLDIPSIRVKHKVFGEYLERFYIDCQKVKLTRDQISELVGKYFPGLTVFNRSDYRAYSKDYKAIIEHAESVNSLSTYPNRLLNLWRNSVKKVEVDKKLEEAKVSGIAVDSKTGEPEKVVNREKIMGTVNIKSGIEPDMPTGIWEPVKAIQHFIASGNAIIQHYNSGAYTGDQIDEVERFVTNLVLHINSPDVMDQVFEKSEKKLKAV